MLTDLLAAKKQLEDEMHENEKPSKSHRSYLPYLRDGLIKLSKCNFDREENIVTFIFGIIGVSYTKEYYEDDLKDVLEYFNLRDSNSYRRILMKSLDDDPRKLDARDAIKEIDAVVHLLSQRGASKIRIVRIGVLMNPFYYDAVAYLLSNWRTTNDEKYVQYVTSLDDNEKSQLEFFKSLVTRGVCTEVEYMNSQDYYPFGEYKSRWNNMTK